MDENAAMITRHKEHEGREDEQQIRFAAQNIMIKMIELRWPEKQADVKGLAAAARECAEILSKPVAEKAK